MMNLVDIKQTLTPKRDEIESLPVHVRSFCALLVPEFRAQYIQLVDNPDMDEFRRERYGYVAFLGFALFMTNKEEIRSKFVKEIGHYEGRKYFLSNKAARFEIDSVALLGVATGLHCMPDYKNQLDWFLELLMKSENALQDDTSQLSVIQIARLLLTDGNWLDVSDASVKVALAHVYSKKLPADMRQDAWKDILDIPAENDIVQLSLKRAVFESCALFVSSMPINGAGLSELIELLKNISESMSHWTFEKSPRVRNAEMRKWHIDHEYHVQNLLWTILKPIFPDLVDEESLPKVGHKTPRYDLGIPSLQIVIEVKFMKKSGQAACAKIIEEIAADNSLYLNPSTNYKSIIAFIWDDCRQTEEYGVLTRGIESLSGIEKAIILARPKRMD